MSFVIASQRVRLEVAGPMISSAKQSKPTQCLDCFIAYAPRNDEVLLPRCLAQRRIHAVLPARAILLEIIEDIAVDAQRHRFFPTR